MNQSNDMPPRRRKGDLAKAEKAPRVLPVNAGDIPAELKPLPQWVCWRQERRDGRWTKIPVNPKTGGNAAANDPSTWGTFAEALARCQREQARYAGAGFMFSEHDPYAGVDLDDCLDADTGAVDPWAGELLQALNGYAEVSPSGTGAKVIVKARKPGGKCRKKYATGEVEIYDRGRFFALTGRRLPDSTTEIPERQSALAEVYARVFGAKEARPPSGPAARREEPDGGCPLPLNVDEQARWECLRTDKRGRIAALWGGDTSGHGGDDSRADAALCSFLVILTNGDRARAEQLFGQSALGRRPKWTGREDYRERTFAFALDGFERWANDPARRQEREQPRNVAAVQHAPTAEQPAYASEIILAFWQENYDLTFRRGGAVYSSRLARELRAGELLVGAPSLLIDRLAGAQEAQRTEQGVVRSKLPGLFRTWAPTAWADLLAQLPDESRSEEVATPARESFRAMMTRGLLSEVALQYRHLGDGVIAEVQRRPLIEWAKLFAKRGVWADVRGLRIWSRLEGEPPRLRVALRVELFGGQVRCGDLAHLSPREFAELCEQYGVGLRCKVFGGATRAVELAPEFLDEVFAAPIEPGDTPPGTDGRTDRQTAGYARTPENASVCPSVHAQVGGGGCGASAEGCTHPEEGVEGRGESETGSADQDGRGDAREGP